VVDRRHYIHGISHNDPTPTTALAQHENDIMSELEIVGFDVRIKDVNSREFNFSIRE